MSFDPSYRDDEHSRDEVDQMPGYLLLEFGADWCGHCRQLSPAIEAVLQNNPQLQHLRIADGRGKRLGRSFRVKLWPTLVFLRDGEVAAQLVRPDPSEVREATRRLLAD